MVDLGQDDGKVQKETGLGALNVGSMITLQGNA